MNEAEYITPTPLTNTGDGPLPPVTTPGSSAVWCRSNLSVGTKPPLSSWTRRLTGWDRPRRPPSTCPTATEVE